MKAKKNKYKVAVALQYEDTQNDAPLISLKGERQRADAIVKVANRFGVPVVEKPELARALNAFNLDQAISPELYEAVAIVLRELAKKD